MDAINYADTGFLLLCTALVCLMTPGLALFYGGLVNARNVLHIMMQNFICMGVVAIIWVFGGFSLAFGTDIGGVLGSVNSYFGMWHIGIVPNSKYAPQVPFILFFAYQMMFAIITPALMTGSFADRIHFTAYLKFLVLWMFLVYIPVAHWIWGGGFLHDMGVVDFAGGIVVHTTAGFSALVAAKFIGPSKAAKNQSNGFNLPLVAIGAGLLWFGWFGFNSGGAYSPNGLAAYAFTNTTLAGSTGMLVWLIWAWMLEKKPTFTGTLVGAVAGLATITPAAGYVEPAIAILIGAIGATCCYFAKHIQRLLKVDDMLEVWRAHGVGGAVGSLLIGLCASSVINQVNASWDQFLVQLFGVILVAVYSMCITIIILFIIKSTGKLRVHESMETAGVDQSIYGEDAYHLHD